MNRYNIITAVILTSCAYVAVTQNAARCFQFTWLGQRYTNESVYLNATCQDATRLANNIPCQKPLIVSEDGTWPNVTYIWENYGREASCELARNDICAQYTYYFNGQVENSTYMCTQAVDNYGQAITSGCFQETKGSFSTKVCFCQSVAGAIPCNHAVTSFLSASTLIMTIVVLFL